jgi:hypothetical protein
MKSKIFILYGLIIAMVFMNTSCEDAGEFVIFDEKYVAFTTSSASLAESSLVQTADGDASIVDNSLVITLVRSTTDFSNPLTVSISEEAVYLSDSDFANAGEDASIHYKVDKDLSSLTFPAGEAFVSFTVTSIDDLIPFGDKSVTFTITSVSDDNFRIGQQESAIRSSFSLILVDDDCPIDLVADWEGQYEVTEFCAPEGSPNAGFCRGAGVVGQIVTLTADPSDPLGVTAILSGGIHDADAMVKFIPCPEDVELAAEYQLSFIQNGQPARIFPLTDAQKANFGTGNFNPGNNTFNIFVGYGNIAGANFGAFEITYSKID